MAAKKSTPTTTAQKTGVDKIIDKLVKQRGQIGGIVVAFTRKADTPLKSDECEAYDSSVLSADLYSGSPESDSMDSPACRGLVALAEKSINRGRGPFG